MMTDDVLKVIKGGKCLTCFNVHKIICYDYEVEVEILRHNVIACTRI